MQKSSAGFVWRLKDDGGNATDISFSDNPNEIVNMSVWESVDALKHFMFKTHHIDFLKRKKEWFETPTEATYVLWWIPTGHIPTIEEAKQKLNLIRKHAETAEAFSFKKVFDSPTALNEYISTSCFYKTSQSHGIISPHNICYFLVYENLLRRQYALCAEFFTELGECQVFSHKTVNADMLADADVLLVRSTTKVNANLLSKNTALNLWLLPLRVLIM